MYEGQPTGSQPEFWREESLDDRREMRRLALRWGLLFFGLLAFMFFALWWASQALQFGASRVDGSARPTYVVSGFVRSAVTGAAVPFAAVTDEPASRPPLFETRADVRGSFILMTLAEPHKLRVSALGFKPGELRVGKAWYRWFPHGSERIEVRLEPE